MIDSGTLSIHGEPIPDAPPLMSALYLTAILAAPDTGSLEVVRPGVGRSGGDRRGWHPIAKSDSALAVGQLRYGERAPLPELQFRITLETPPPTGPLWIVFHISGNTVELMAPLAAGGDLVAEISPVVSRCMPAAITTFAANWIWSAFEF